MLLLLLLLQATAAPAGVVGSEQRDEVDDNDDVDEEVTAGLAVSDCRRLVRRSMAVVAEPVHSVCECETSGE